MATAGVVGRSSRDADITGDERALAPMEALPCAGDTLRMATVSHATAATAAVVNRVRTDLGLIVTVIRFLGVAALYRIVIVHAVSGSLAFRSSEPLDAVRSAESRDCVTAPIRGQQHQSAANEHEGSRR